MSPNSSTAATTPRVLPFLRLLRTHLWSLIALLCLTVGVSYVAPRIVLGPQMAVEHPVMGNLVQTVVASGHVETPYRVEIGSQITGTVSDVLVEEGQSVKRGQPLITIEATEASAALVQATGSLSEAEARLRQIEDLTLPSAREALKQAQATLVNAQAIYDRAASLFKNGFETRATLDDAQKALDIARTQVATAQLQVYTNSPGGSARVVAETQLAQARANLDVAKARLSYTTIIAPRDGTLITRNVERGTVVQAGKALLVLAPSGEIQLVLQIDEKNMNMIRLGETALASADAFPDQTFPATVTYINPSVDITRASVEVKLTATQPPSYLIQDMTVSVDIEVARRNDTMILPTRAVHDLTSAPWVMKVENGKTVREPVKTGIRAAGSVEILSGVALGDSIVPSTSDVRPGTRVRVKSP